MTTAPPPSTTAAVHVTVLGSTAVVGPGSRTEVTGRRPRDLLLTLALARGRSVSADRLVGALWTETAPVSPRAALHTVVARLRAVRPEVVVSTPHGYALGVPSDIDLVESATREATVLVDGGRPEDALGLVRDARTRCGADRPVQAETEVEVEEVRGALLLAVDRAELAALVALGDDAEAVRVAEPLSARRPADEALHLVLMRCYARLGRTNDALRVFSRVRDAVAAELGSTPGAALVRLNAELLRQSDETTLEGPGPSAPPALSLLSADSPAPRRRRSVGLRSAPTPMVGRVEEVESLLALLGSERLVTLLGPGGLGKTRTAQEAARRTDAAGVRVVVVELASVRTDDDVALALASTLEVRDDAGGRRISDRLVHSDASTRVAERLAEEPTLLVLDNCEHVVDGAAAWASELLASVEGLSVLATSRSPLLVGGEQLVRLAPLSTSTPLDGGAGPAVELFEARARAVRPEAALPRDVVVRLCDRLDGLPLAIELAAARVSSMTVVEVERRLTRRFELLTGGGRTAPERHRTLEAVIGWSWELLTGAERALLRRTSVFPSGFSAQAAHTVAGLRAVVRTAPAHLSSGDAPSEQEVTVLTLDLLSGLVDQSLLTVHEDPATGAARYRMLETVREFGALRLEESGETQAAEDAFFVWAVEHSEREWPSLTEAGQVDALARARLEQENLVHVLRRSTAAGRGDVVITVFGLLGLFWTLSGAHSDVVASAPEVLSASATTPVPPERAGTVALALLVVLTTTFTTQEHVRRRALLRLRAVLDSPAPLPAVVRELGAVAVEAVDLSAAGSALERARQSGDGFVAAVACVVSAQLAENAGDLAQAQEHAQAGYELAVARGETWGAASAAMLLGQLASEQARPAEALGWLARSREGLLLLEATADLDEVTWLESSSLVALGRVAEAEVLLAGLSASAEDPTRPSSYQDAEDARAVHLSGRAEIAYVSGDPQGAMRLYESARDHMRGTSSGRSPWFLVFGASVVCLAVLGDVQDHLRRSAPNLRARTVAQHRLAPRFTDRPILGTASLALGAYLVHEPALGRVEDGLLLLAAAERLGSRQDVPSLLRSTHEDAARRLHGAEALEAARSAVRAVPADEVVGLVLDVLRRGPWERCPR